MADEQERAGLLAAITEQRETLLRTVRDVSEAQANRRSTVSELTLAGIIKHVNRMEHSWTRVLETMDFTELLRINADFQEQYHLGPDETLAGMVGDYAQTALRTEKIVAALPDLDVSFDIPEMEWGPATSWSARRTLLWILRETAHHCGHADIIRESLDGVVADI